MKFTKDDPRCKETARRQSEARDRMLRAGIRPLVRSSEDMTKPALKLAWSKVAPVVEPEPEPENVVQMKGRRKK